MNKIHIVLLLLLIAAAVSAQEEVPPAEEAVEEDIELPEYYPPWSWYSARGVFTFIILCSCFSSACVGGFGWIVARHRFSPLKAQLFMAEAKAKARRD